MISPGIVSAQASGGGGGGYTASAVHFDGATSLGIASLTATDNAFFSCSLWFKVSADQVGFPMYACDPSGDDNNTGDFSSNDPGNSLLPRCYLGQGGAHGFFHVGGADFTNFGWHHLLFSADLTNAAMSRAAKMYVDDVDVTNILADSGIAGTTLAFNGLQFLFGDDGFGDLITGDFADVWIAPGVSLLTAGDIPVATRRIFIDGSGKPVNPSGFPASRILFIDNASTFPTNQGTGGAFTLTGSLTNASSSPSD